MDYRVSVLICTRNRADLVVRAISSLGRSTIAPHEVIVSDDSTDDLTQLAVRDLNVTYYKGPCRGLGANRNYAIAKTTGNFILFLDDDAILGETFLEEAIGCNRKEKDPPTCIVTGIEEQENGQLVYPSEQSFLGFQHVRYLDTAGLSTVVINSTLFPVELFSHVLFDERLVYGCDEVDLTTRAITKGFQITLCNTAINKHYRAESNRSFYRTYLNASRIYVTAKRYLFTERSIFKGLVFMSVAPVHLLAGSIKRSGLKGIPESLRSIRLYLSYLSSYFYEYRCAGADRIS